MFVGFDFDIIGTEGLSAPGTIGELQWRAFAAQATPHAVVLTDGFGGIFCPVGRGALTDPQPDAERFFAPAGFVVAADKFHGADESGGALELLQGEQAQGIAHQHRDTRCTRIATHIALQAAQGHGEGGHAQIGFGFTAAGREPEQIGFGMSGVDTVGVGWVLRAGMLSSINAN